MSRSRPKPKYCATWHCAHCESENVQENARIWQPKNNPINSLEYDDGRLVLDVVGTSGVRERYPLRIPEWVEVSLRPEDCPVGVEPLLPRHIGVSFEHVGHLSLCDGRRQQECQ